MSSAVFAFLIYVAQLRTTKVKEVCQKLFKLEVPQLLDNQGLVSTIPFKYE